MMEMREVRNKNVPDALWSLALTYNETNPLLPTLSDHNREYLCLMQMDLQH